MGVGIISSIMFRKARNALARHNGVMTWEFSQQNLDVWKIIAQNASSRQGICKALAAQWIVDHAYGGHLANRVLDDRGNMNQSAIRMIMQNFIIAIQGNQEVDTVDFLVKRGLLPRMASFNKDIFKEKRVGRHNVTTKIVVPSAKSMDDTASDATNVAVQLAEAMKKVNNCYAQVSFGAANGMGHATAVWIAEDACFYDPNAGEFYFSNRKDFFNWFEFFYKNSYQGWPCNFNGRYAVSQFALSNTASKGAYAKAVLSVAGAR